MPTACCVIGCKSRGNAQPGIQFFQLPLNKPKVLTQWLIVLDRRDWVPKPSSRICSLHFSSDDYLLRTNSNVPRLKPEAIPSVFPDLSETNSQDENVPTPPKNQAVEENEIDSPVKEVKKIKENKIATPRIATPLVTGTPSQRPRRVSKLNPRMKDFILLDDIKKHKHSTQNTTPGRPPPSEKEKAAQELLSILEDSSSLSGDESSKPKAIFSSKSTISSLAKAGVSISIVSSGSPHKTNSILKSSGSNIMKDKNTSFKSPLGNSTPKSINKQWKPSKKIVLNRDEEKSDNTIILEDSSEEEEIKLPTKSRKVATKSTGGVKFQRNFKGKVSDSTKYTVILPDGKGSLSIDKTKVIQENSDTTSISEGEHNPSVSSDFTNIRTSANESTSKPKSLKKSVPSAFRKTYFQVKEGEKIYYFSYADLNPIVDLTKENKLYNCDNSSLTLGSGDENEKCDDMMRKEFYNSDLDLSLDIADDEIFDDTSMGEPSPPLTENSKKKLSNKKGLKKSFQSPQKEIKKRALEINPINEIAYDDEINMNESTMHEASVITLEDGNTAKFLSDIGITPPVISKVSKNFKITSPLKRKKRFKTVAEIVVRTDNTGQIPSVSIDKINNLLDFESESPKKKIKRPKTSFIASITPDHNIAPNLPTISTTVVEDSLDKFSQNISEVIKNMKVFDKLKDKGKLTVVITSLPPVKEKEALIITKKDLVTNEENNRELKVSFTAGNVNGEQDGDGNSLNIPVVGVCSDDSSIDENLMHNKVVDSSVQNSEKEEPHGVNTADNNSVELSSLQKNTSIRESTLVEEVSLSAAKEAQKCGRNASDPINGSLELNSGSSEEKKPEVVMVPLRHDHTYMTVVSSPHEKSAGEIENSGGTDQSKEVFSKLKLSESEISFRTKVSQKLRLLKENVKRKSETIGKLKDKIKFLEKTLREERRTKKRFTKPRKVADTNPLYDHILDENALVKSREYSLNSGDVPLEFEENAESDEEDRECSSPITYLCEPAIDVCEKPNLED